jgi:hypothetical protein
LYFYLLSSFFSFLLSSTWYKSFSKSEYNFINHIEKHVDICVKLYYPNTQTTEIDLYQVQIGTKSAYNTYLRYQLAQQIFYIGIFRQSYEARISTCLSGHRKIIPYDLSMNDAIYRIFEDTYTLGLL